MRNFFNRHQAGARVAGEKTGGRFKARTRTTATASLLASSEQLAESELEVAKAFERARAEEAHRQFCVARELQAARNLAPCNVHGAFHQYRSVRFAATSNRRCTCPAAVVGEVQSATETMGWLVPSDYVGPRDLRQRYKRRSVPMSTAVRSVRMEDTGEAFTLGPLPFEADMGVKPIPYRHFDGQLYEPVTAEAPGSTFSDIVLEHQDATPELISRLVHRHHVDNQYDSEEMLRERLGKTAGEYLVIDGKLWRITEEPVYEVGEFGLQRTPRSANLAPDDHVYPLDDFEKARKRAVRIARRRGDLAEVARIQGEVPFASLPKNRPWRRYSRDSDSYRTP